MFPSMIARAVNLDVISAGMGGTGNGAIQVMHAEVQLRSQLVPVRQVRFVRICKQHAEGVWAVVDVSVDIGHDSANAQPFMPCRRLPSGCIVQDMPNGYSKQKLYKATNLKFPLCCAYVRVVLPHYAEPTQPIKYLFLNTDRKSKYFQEHIRSFNNMFAFTSMGGKIQRNINVGGAPPIFVMNRVNYHQISSLMPLPGDHPKFAQLYIYDTDNEITNWMAVVGMEDDNSRLQSSLVKLLRDTLDSCNPYVQTYRFVCERILFGEPQNVKLCLIGKRGCDVRRYNLPSASEVAGLIVGDFELHIMKGM